MGMAHRAPMDSYKRKFYVSDHAIERLRDRWAQMPSHQHRNDPDLGHFIDTAVCSAVAAGRVEDLYDVRETTHLRVVDVSEELQDGLFAIVKENAPRPRGAPEEAVVSLVGAEMVKSKKRNGAWTTPPMPEVKAVRTSLGDKLGKVAVSVPPPPREATPKVEVEYQITYQDEFFEPQSVRCSKTEVAEKVAGLSTGANHNVEVWKKVRFKTKVTVEIEVEP